MNKQDTKRQKENVRTYFKSVADAKKYLIDAFDAEDLQEFLQGFASNEDGTLTDDDWLGAANGIYETYELS